MTTKQKQNEVNEVPLSETLQQAADKFLRAVKDNEWDEDENTASALVLVFRSNGNGGVDANVLNEGLGDDYQKLMTDAALKAISGKPLFYTVE
jgi:hypothetical protein